MSGKVLIKGGTVLTLDRSIGNHVAADVLIEDGVVTEVGSSLRTRSAETIDASDAIVMPGFVDAHRHVWHALFRNAGPGPSPISHAAVGRAHGPDHVYAATLVGLLGAVETGITTVVDWADIPRGSSFVEAALQAHADVGLRTVFVVTQAQWADTGYDGAGLEALVGDRRRGPDLTLAFGATDPERGRLDDATAVWPAARRAGVRIHAHVGTDVSHRGAVAGLGEAGLLGEDVTLVHCTDLDDRDLDAIASSKTAVALTPSVEMTNGVAAPPLQALIDRGIRPGLGVGSEIEAPGDLFAQMRVANAIQHATLFDLKLAGKGGVPNLLSTRDVIRYGTIDGATAAGLGAVTGSLTPGKRGDVIVMRTDRPNIAPVNDPIGAVVWGMDTSNIEWVLVGGRAVVEHGALTADVARARQLATKAQREVAAASGLLADTGTAQA